MTMPAKIEANRRNAGLSTGPRTVEGKAVVARNATKHGIFTVVPVIPGECPDEWEAHRAGVVESLDPDGLLEVNLAERAALLLWRLQRLARYEAETTAVEIEEAEAPPLPSRGDELDALLPLTRRATREDQLRGIRANLHSARQELAVVTPACAFFADDAGTAPDRVIPFGVATTIFEAALVIAESSETVRGDPPSFDGKIFLKKLCVAESEAAKVSWTPDLIRRGLLVYAGFAGEPADRFQKQVRADLSDRAVGCERAIRRLNREAAAVARLVDRGPAGERAAKLLPGDGRDERIAKYERHLHSLLTSTLHELERLQARRIGESVPAPAVADVNVTIDPGAG